MQRYINLQSLIIDKANLEEAAYKAQKGKKCRRSIARFYKKFDKNIKKIRASLLDRTFTTSTYNVKIIKEPKLREIYVLPFSPDRIVQHALMNIVEPLIDKRLYEYSVACRPGKGIHTGLEFVAKAIHRNDYAWKFDVRKFYPSINHDLCFEMIERLFNDNFVLWLFRDIIDSIDGETNIPIGNYVSQWLGNLYLSKLDDFIKHKLKIRDYVRYCDDFIIFSKYDRITEDGLVAEIIGFLEEELQLYPSKSFEINIKKGDPIDFLGYVTTRKKRVLRKTSELRFYDQFKYLYYALHHEAIPLEEIRCQLYSLLGWIKWASFGDQDTHVMLYKLEDELHIAEHYGVDTLNKLRRSDKYHYDPKSGLYLTRNARENKKRVKRLKDIAGERKFER